jgi:hypothetical protein
MDSNSDGLAQNLTFFKLLLNFSFNRVLPYTK